MTPTWTILAIPCAATLASWVVMRAVRTLRRRRAEWESALAVARRVAERADFDAWEKQFASEGSETP